MLSVVSVTVYDFSRLDLNNNKVEEVKNSVDFDFY